MPNSALIGWPACASGSPLNTSSAAPAMRFSRNAATSAASSTIAPRDTLIRNADRFIRPSSRAPIRWRVSRIEHRVDRDDVALRQQRVQFVDLLDAPCPHRLARHMRVVADHPHAEARRHARHAAADPAGTDHARACGRRDRPRSMRAVGQAQPFVAISRPIGISFFASAIISANAPSATVSSAYSGTFTTGMPRAIAAAISIASMPTPYLTMPLSFGARLDHARGDRRVAHQQECRRRAPPRTTRPRRSPRAAAQARSPPRATPRRSRGIRVRGRCGPP